MVSEIKKFFKNHETVDQKVSDLYNRFKAARKKELTLEEFEQALILLKKKIIIRLKEKCRQYIANMGTDSYAKFIREEEYISKKFWDDVGAGVLVNSLPSGWTNFHWVQKEKFIKTVTNRELLDYLLSRENLEPVKTACRDRIAKLEFNKSFEMAPEPSADLIPPGVVPLSRKRPAARTRQPKDQKPNWGGITYQPVFLGDPESETKERYAKLLPVSWVKMTFPERVDFTRKVQHEGFFSYILESDKKLKEYFSKMNHVNPERVKLYVTVFSFPSDSYSEESKNLLKTFVNSLNMTGRARLQYVQCSEPNVIEIREVR
jgi:hypothetical protein